MMPALLNEPGVIFYYQIMRSGVFSFVLKERKKERRRYDQAIIYDLSNYCSFLNNNNNNDNKSPVH